MTDGPLATREEVERIRRVADLLCSAHATLRDRYQRYALLLDLVILLSSAWLTAVAFLDPRFSKSLTPFGLDHQLWIGLMGVLTFCLTLVQLKTDWRGRSEAHDRTFGMYSEVKREAGYLLASTQEIPAREFQRLTSRYDMASDVGTGVPEAKFLSLKRRHRLKVEISKMLDNRPGASISLTKLSLLIRDNWPWSKR
jgi:hypothetical protein